MTAPIIQLPFLRPETVHEVPGGVGGVGSALEGIGQMLAARQAMQEKMHAELGRLSLEQAQFEAERKDKALQQKQRQTSIDALNHILSGGQLPPPQIDMKGPTGQSPAAQAPQGQPSAQPQPQQDQPGMGDVAAAFPQIAEQLMRVQHQQQVGQQFGAVLGQYNGAQLRNDPVTRMEAVGKLMAIDPASAEAWERANPARKVTLKSTGNAVLAFDDQTGQFLGMKVGTGKLTAMQQRFQAFAPQYQQGVDNMTKIERADPAAVQVVSSALIGSGIKFASVGDFTSAIAKAGFTGNAAKYAMFLRNAVEGSLGFQIGSRGGKDFQDLIQNTLLPGPNEVNDPDAMAARQRMRLTRLEGFKQSLQNQMFAPNEGEKPDTMPKDSLDGLEAAADSLGLPK